MLDVRGFSTYYAEGWEKFGIVLDIVVTITIQTPLSGF
jgi:hypothetical protein